VSYIIGREIGNNLKSRRLMLSPDSRERDQGCLLRAKPIMTEEEMREVMTAFQNEVMAKRQELAKQLRREEQEGGESFLAQE